MATDQQLKLHPDSLAIIEQIELLPDDVQSRVMAELADYISPKPIVIRRTANNEFRAGPMNCPDDIAWYCASYEEAFETAKKCWPNRQMWCSGKLVFQPVPPSYSTDTIKPKSK